jgi:hypothetical protein
MFLTKAFQWTRCPSAKAVVSASTFSAGTGGLPILERRLDCLEKCVRIEIEMVRTDPDIVKVFHAAVSVSERNHGLKFLRD